MNWRSPLLLLSIIVSMVYPTLSLAGAALCQQAVIALAGPAPASPARVSASEQRTGLQAVYALLAEKLVNGSFEVSSGDRTYVVRTPEEAMSLNYSVNFSSPIHIVHRSESGRVTPLFPLEAYFRRWIEEKGGSRESGERFLSELRNHLEISRRLEREKEEFYSGLRLEQGLWQTILQTPRDLLRRFLLRLSSQSGHRLHILGKMRLGLSHRRNDRFFPEWGSPFSLNVVAVRREHVGTSIGTGARPELLPELNHRFPGFSGRWERALRQRDLNPADYLPIFLHPLQRALIREEIQQHSQTMIEIGAFGPSVVPTMSFRTVSAIDGLFSRIKLPLSLQMTSEVRRIEPETIALGPQKSSLLLSLLPRNGGHLSSYLEVLPEYVGVYLRGTFPEALKTGLNMVLRGDPFSVSSRRDLIPIELNSLFERPPGRAKTLIEDIMHFAGVRTSEQALRFFSEMAEKTLDATLGSFLRYGISLEAHQQNTFLMFNTRTGRYVKLLIQDLADGVEIFRPVFSRVFRGFERVEPKIEKSLFSDITMFLRQEMHTTFYSHLLPMAMIVSRSYDIPMRDVLRALETRVEHLFERVAQETRENRNFTPEQIREMEAFHAQVRAAILENPVTVKSLLQMRLQQTEQRVRVEMDNPFSEAN